MLKCTVRLVTKVAHPGNQSISTINCFIPRDAMHSLAPSVVLGSLAMFSLSRRQLCLFQIITGTCHKKCSPSGPSDLHRHSTICWNRLRSQPRARLLVDPNLPPGTGQEKALPRGCAVPLIESASESWIGMDVKVLEVAANVRFFKK